MLLFLLALLAGLVLLSFAADRFVDGAAGLATNLGVSKLVVGLVVVGFGTSAPELLVSARAALGDAAGIAIGNALGSNVSNIALVIGLAAVIRPLPVESGIIRREFPILGAATLATLLLLVDGETQRSDGLLLCAMLVGVMVLLLRLSLRASPVDPVVLEVEASDRVHPTTRRAVTWTLAGLAGMLVGSEALVWGAKGAAESLGVPDLVIGLTIVAVGTSLPELAAAVAAARKDEGDLVIGNVIGSNLFNTLGVLGVAATLAPGEVPAGVLERDYPIMMLLSLAFFVASMTPRGAGIVTRREGLLFLAAFAAYELLLAFG